MRIRKPGTVASSHDGYGRGHECGAVRGGPADSYRSVLSRYSRPYSNRLRHYRHRRFSGLLVRSVPILQRMLPPPAGRSILAPVVIPTREEVDAEARRRGLPYMFWRLEPVLENMRKHGMFACEALQAAGLNRRLERLERTVNGRPVRPVPLDIPDQFASDALAPRSLLGNLSANTPSEQFR
jgi:hypothetical protein